MSRNLDCFRLYGETAHTAPESKGVKEMKYILMMNTELAGELDAAVRHYRAVAAKTANLPERNYLMMQAARLSAEHM
jgi:hypothetical protein